MKNKHPPALSSRVVRRRSTLKMIPANVFARVPPRDYGRTIETNSIHTVKSVRIFWLPIRPANEAPTGLACEEDRLRRSSKAENSFDSSAQIRFIYGALTLIKASLKLRRSRVCSIPHVRGCESSTETRARTRMRTLSTVRAHAGHATTNDGKRERRYQQIERRCLRGRNWALNSLETT